MASLKLGTRGSQLALFQAHAVAGLLESRAGVGCEIIVIRTSGDRLAEAPLSEVGGKRLFVKEIEDALLEGRIDLAVHSSKDMPAVLPAGLMLGAVLPREDARDAVVLPIVAGPLRGTRPATEEGTRGTSEYVGRVPQPASPKPTAKAGSGPAELEEIVQRLGPSPRIGTSSVRRTAQLARLFSGARFAPIRGNLDTRLRKVDAGEFDALVLAAAGLIRLGHERRISVALPPDACIPAPGQGIIAVEVREDDGKTTSVVKQINDPVTLAALTAERAVVTRLGGGCQMPIGAYASESAEGLTLMAIVLSVDGSRTARADAHGPLGEAAFVGARAAEDLLARGAGEILAEVDQARAVVEGLQP
jgi:hydroxymethylbilane synthase